MAPASSDENDARPARDYALFVARRDISPDEFDADGGLVDETRDLALLAMVGMADPPRPGVKDPIAECKDAGVRVRMLTGDHAVTAAAVADELGIEG